MTRTQLIQGYIDLTGARRYVEVGLGNMANFNAIRCESKTGIDPDIPKATAYTTENGRCYLYKMTSDDFFDEINDESLHGDITFIDGLHEHTQVMRDIQNAMKYLSPNGLILLHDTNPPDEHTARPLSQLEKYPPDGEAWTGDVWKAVCCLNAFEMTRHTHREDYGLTVIPKQAVHEDFAEYIPLVSAIEFFKYKSFTLNLLPPNTPAVLP